MEALIIYIFVGGLCTEGNLRFQIDWASLIIGRKFTAFLCLTLYLRAISKYKPPGGRGLVFGGAIYRRVFALGGLYFEGVILRGAYFWNFTVRPTSIPGVSSVFGKWKIQI